MERTEDGKVLRLEGHAMGVGSKGRSGSVEAESGQGQN